jgi:hypothetical protein
MCSEMYKTNAIKTYIMNTYTKKLNIVCSLTHWTSYLVETNKITIYNYHEFHLKRTVNDIIPNHLRGRWDTGKHQ